MQDSIVRIEILERKFDEHTAAFHNLVDRFEARGKNHEDNARMMRLFAEDYNKISIEKEKLKEELHLVKVEQATHAFTLRQVGEMQKDFKELGSKLINEVSEIKNYITKAVTRDTTAMQIGKFLLQLVGIGCTVAVTAIGVAKYFD